MGVPNIEVEEDPEDFIAKLDEANDETLKNYSSLETLRLLTAVMCLRALLRRSLP